MDIAGTAGPVFAAVGTETHASFTVRYFSDRDGFQAGRPGTPGNRFPVPGAGSETKLVIVPAAELKIPTFGILQIGELGGHGQPFEFNSRAHA